METSLSWVATIATVTAASIVASNLGARITGYGFIIFTIGSLAWLALGLMTGQPALMWTNIALTFLNLFGIWRWLGRQAKVEDGSRAAAIASHATPGEDLFPVSLLMRAKLRSKGTQLGTCVDAMAGCRSGRISYVMVSEGGLAGAGEHLRRLPWSELHVEEDEAVAHLDERQFCALDTVPKDQWPAR
ncbi:MAG TPA: PRC-barrel domain containing protein [Sphingomicrobium sp.]|nr:PRC-barrel domain containing protein [Sphingomicrobium sp.]